MQRPRLVLERKFLTERLRDRILQFEASWSSDQDKDGQERLESSLEMSQKQATEDCDEITDVERLRRSPDSSVEAGVGGWTNTERFQHAPAMSMIGENDNDEIGSVNGMPVEPDEGNEIDEERLQRALTMSMMDENGCEEYVTAKDPSSNTAGRLILVVSSVYCLVANMRCQIASRP